MPQWPWWLKPTIQPSRHPGLRPFPAVRQDLKGPSFPAKPLLGFWEGSEDRERKPQTLITLIAVSTFGPWPSPGDTLGRLGRGVQRTRGWGAAPATFHPETPPGGGEGVILPSDKQHRIRSARGGPGTERGWRRQDRDMPGLSDLEPVICFCSAWTRGAAVPSGLCATLLMQAPLSRTCRATAEPDHQSLRTLSYRETQWGSDGGTITFCISEKPSAVLTIKKPQGLLSSERT